MLRVISILLGIIFLIVGIFGFIGMFISKAGPPNLDNGIAYFIGRISPVIFLILSYFLLRKKNVKKE